MAKHKINVAVIFGGQSGEHEVSLVSAEAVMKNLDRKKYNVIPVGISKEGLWIAGNNSLKLLKDANADKGLKALITPDATIKTLETPGQLNMKTAQKEGITIVGRRIDVVFPVMHGTFGEDGTIQGLLEMANLPYVGCGVLGSAVAMDKITQKELCAVTGLFKMADWVWLTKKEWAWWKRDKRLFKKWLSETEKKLGYPMFVKPSNLGSSVAINKAHSREELVKFINVAAKYDRRIVIEQGIEGVMEIEVAILGNEKPQVSVAGQIVASNEFYDYDAKYVAGASKEVIPAALPKDISYKVRQQAIEVFKLLDLAGMARADFFVTEKKGKWKVYFNEVNTIPGFTSISMYPKLWQASGLPYKKLLDKLIGLALERFKEKQQLKRGSGNEEEWYKSK